MRCLILSLTKRPENKPNNTSQRVRKLAPPILAVRVVVKVQLSEKYPVFRINEFGFIAQLSDLFRHLFSHTISYLISFPLMMGEGWDGGGRLGPPPT